ncbi:MAG TPA: DUF892 family protein [Bryobacteraceae bacterium]|nr:DUF892 family protein [Bryobacteraceae bacterium]
MPETSNQVIVRYLEDAIAAEGNFENQLSSLSKGSAQGFVRDLFAKFSTGARSQKETLTERLQSLGGSPSTAKGILARLLAFSPMLAQAGQHPQDKDTQHLIMVAGAAGAEMAMYEAMAVVAAAAGDAETEGLARHMQTEERSDREKTWEVLGRSASLAFHSVAGESASGGEKPREIIRRYLQDAIAAERTFEDQLRSFAGTGNLDRVQQLFRTHADETRTQYERLEPRLRTLGGSPSVMKSALAHMFAFAPAAAQIGHEAAEKNTQHLMIAYAVENAEMAMYEAFSVAAQAAGDPDSLALAREIQEEERRPAEEGWSQIAGAARAASAQVTERRMTA